jgi:hypothetical protein
VDTVVQYRSLPEPNAKLVLVSALTALVAVAAYAGGQFLYGWRSGLLRGEGSALLVVCVASLVLVGATNVLSLQYLGFRHASPVVNGGLLSLAYQGPNMALGLLMLTWGRVCDSAPVNMPARIARRSGWLL